MQADTSSQDAKKLRQLEERCRLASDDLFKKRKDLQRLHTDLDEDRRRLDQLRAQRQRLDDEIKQLQSSREQVAKEVSEQQEKLQRATETVEAKRKQHREMHGSSAYPSGLAWGLLVTPLARAVQAERRTKSAP